MADDGPPPDCTTSIEKVTFLDLRGGNSGGGAVYSRCNATNYSVLVGYAKTLVSGNGFGVHGSALAGSTNNHRDQNGNLDQLGQDDLGHGANANGVLGEAASRSSAGVHGINYGADGPDGPEGGPGVQEDTVALPNSVGVLGVADVGGTALAPTRAIQGNAIGDHALAAWFRATRQVVTKFSSTHTGGTAIQLRPEPANGSGADWWIVSTASAGDPGDGRFALYSASASPARYVLHIAKTAPANALHVESNGTAIGQNGTPIALSISGSTAWDPANISDGATDSTTVSVPNAVQGDPCFAGFNNITGANLILSCAITSNDTATVTLLNKTGSAQNLGNGTLRATAFHYE